MERTGLRPWREQAPEPLVEERSGRPLRLFKAVAAQLAAGCATFCEMRNLGPLAPAGPLDELDRAVVSQLMEDGRRPFRTIARSVGVPESTVRFRANRLLREGALNIVAMADPHRMGYAVLAVILLRVRPKARARVVQALAALPEVQYLSSCTGRVDLVLQIVCKGQDDLRRLLAEEFPALGGILETETLLELEVHKFKYAYPNLG